MFSMFERIKVSSCMPPMPLAAYTRPYLYFFYLFQCLCWHIGVLNMFMSLSYLWHYFHLCHHVSIFLYLFMPSLLVLRLCSYICPHYVNIGVVILLLIVIHWFILFIEFTENSKKRKFVTCNSSFYFIFWVWT